MTQRESDEQRKLTRRLFIQYSAAASGTIVGAGAMLLKTDAMGQVVTTTVPVSDDGTISYAYH